MTENTDPQTGTGFRKGRTHAGERWIAAYWPLPILILAFFLMAGTGCQSTDKTVSASFASVVIAGNTAGQIRDVTIEVFHENGYKVTQADPENLVLEKEGTRMNNLAYGNWLGDTPVWVRVKAAIVPVGETTLRLQCRAYMIRDRGSSVEEEVALSRLGRGTYQKLLDEVANRFRGK